MPWLWPWLDGIVRAQEAWQWSGPDGVEWARHHSGGHSAMVSCGPNNPGSGVGPMVSSGPDVMVGAMARWYCVDPRILVVEWARRC
jgi:hypothetical protein